MKKGPGRVTRRSALFYVVLAVILLVVFASLTGGSSDKKTLKFSEFEDRLAANQIKSAEIVSGSSVKGEFLDGNKTRKYEVKITPEFADELQTQLNTANGPDGKTRVVVSAKEAQSNIWLSLLFQLLPFAILFGMFFFVINSMQGGGSKVMQFGKAKAKQHGKDQPKVTFADVAGADEAVAELQEIKEFLENPARFAAIGAKIPKGVLLFGPPGTGKTLLARAVAGEAGVPFFHISGSDFVEMFVGVGASRVRDLFEQAKAAAPAIIFVDEIDAVGRHRGAGMGGGHDEREQTLNQLLVEMDGFDVKTGVILIAATNRPDILDPALLRPGRFDRQIVVDHPDIAGRRAILDVHAKGKPIDDTVNLDVLAKRTPGFTGADLANLLNEAAILAARKHLDLIGMAQMDEAIDRVLAGPERRTRVMTDHDKLVTAYHEGGHTLVGWITPHADPIHKVSVVARGRALGITWTLPEDKVSHTRKDLEARITMLMGGRSAEELIFEDFTTGASDDIKKATQLARAMVTEWGMSDTLGPLRWGEEQGEVFLGRDFGHAVNYSQEVAAAIDTEIRLIVDSAYDGAKAILKTHRAELDALAKALVEKETLESSDLEALLGHLSPWVVPMPDVAESQPEPHLAQPEPVGAAARTGEAVRPAAPPAPIRRWRRFGRPAGGTA